MNQRWPFILAAGLLAGSVLLAACGGGGGDGTGTASTGDASAVSPAVPDPTTGGADAEAATPTEQVIADLLDEVEAGDAAGAMTLVCEGSEEMVRTAVDDLARERPDLLVEAFALDEFGVVTADVTGSAGGEPVAVTVGAAEVSTGPCVAALFVTW
ncbi:hypothetical protein ACFQS3_04295 [Glycomyces mayteni]|uniref:Uncharacterized protein n=1 Tax=Glycomyces mayteni TaxID=543887 RepID=A0ABW2D5W7_9ACTN|nr:hypothetical protein GCM10025732_52240 [Glycomyces mayteni]